MDQEKAGSLPRRLRDVLALEKSPPVFSTGGVVLSIPQEVRDAAAYRVDGLVNELRMRVMIQGGYMPSGARSAHGGTASLLTPMPPEARTAQLAKMDEELTPPSPGQ